MDRTSRLKASIPGRAPKTVRPRLGWSLRAGLAVMALIPVQAAPAASWQGWDAWTIGQVAKRYGLEAEQTEESAFRLAGEGVLVEGQAGSRELRVNRLRYELSRPCAQEDGTIMVSPVDILGLLDLLLEPANHMQSAAFRTVWIDIAGAEGGPLIRAKRAGGMLRQVLKQYEVETREAGADPPEKAFVWIRLRESDDLAARTCRCGVVGYSPPESGEGGIHLGELSDGESLLLATLIQSGLVLGPGAQREEVEDGGIVRRPLERFRPLDAPGVEVEWGAGVEAEHLVKSIAAGLLRFRNFLVSEVRAKAQAQAQGRGERTIKLSRVDVRPGEAENTLLARMSVSGPADALAEESRETLQFSLRFFVRDPDGLVRMLPAPTPVVEWTGVNQVPGDEQAIATIRAQVNLEAEEMERIRSGFFGYVIAVSEEGRLQDLRATPKKLVDQLWRW